MNIEPRLPHDRKSPNIDSPDIAPEQIAGLLTRSAEQLDSNTVAALRRARHTALDRQNVHAPAFALDAKHGFHWQLPHTPRQWVATVLLLAVVVGSSGYWQHLRKHEMMTHLDVAILTDDMPMEVFIDHRSE
ncbi:MAG: DUF3619 family protein [Gallionella sp.]|jgi:hypothetical protein|nr:DUF3619 family protein [Gallionella sp.]MCK9354987.1 DUF3619 family protein [Gallionella sp.]